MKWTAVSIYSLSDNETDAPICSLQCAGTTIDVDPQSGMMTVAGGGQSSLRVQHVSETAAIAQQPFAAFKVLPLSARRVALRGKSATDGTQSHILQFASATGECTAE